MTGIAITPFISTVFTRMEALLPVTTNNTRAYLEDEQSLQKKKILLCNTEHYIFLIHFRLAKNEIQNITFCNCIESNESILKI